MTNLFKFSPIFLLLLHTEAQMTLGGPGVEVREYLYSTPSSQSFNLGYHYLYEIQGFYGRTDADQVPDTYVDRNGNISRRTVVTASDSGSGSSSVSISSGDSSANGNATGDTTSVTATITTIQRIPGWLNATLTLNEFQYPRILEYSNVKANENSGDLVLTSDDPLRLKDQNMTLGFHLDGNTQDPDGYIVAFGLAVKVPPRPTGKLIIDNFILEGTEAQIGYEIELEEFEESARFIWNPNSWVQSSN